MSDRYPDLRQCAPPMFLEEKYGSIAVLVETLIRQESASLPAFSVNDFLTKFPTFDSLFSASAEEIEAAIALSTEAASQYRVQLQRMLIWEDLSAVAGVLASQFDRVIAGLPRTLADLEQGGGRDILDPFIVAFAWPLLANGSTTELLRVLLAHKCMMKLEDLIGNLHQEVLGRAAGHERVPEPEGTTLPTGKRDKETWDPVFNPYPGADVRRGESEFYQLKNKTGSAKGGDGARLGKQLAALGERYPGSQRFYASVIGRTLSGHRSMGAVLREDPGAEVLVGLATFQQLGQHRDTADIVMSLYTDEFARALERNHYDFDAVALTISAEWAAKHGDENPAFGMLHDAITPADPSHQSSRTYQPGSGRRRLARLSDGP